MNKKLKAKSSASVQSKPKKKYVRFIPKLRTRHPTHRPLIAALPLFPFRSVIRFGSTTNVADCVTNGGNRIEVNTVEAIKNSANKLLMKQCFTKANVMSADWGKLCNVDVVVPAKDNSKGAIQFSTDLDGCEGLSFPIVSKSHHGSRGTGNRLHKTPEEFNTWRQGKDINNYIVEQFHDYSREYRLHVDKNGCFYTCRKMLKEGTPDNQRWFRNDSNSVWMLEDNPLFDKPVNWNAIITECVKALNAVGLDVGACDVKVQSAKDKKGNVRPNPEFIVIEINSAPSFGDKTLQMYATRIPAILMAKKATVNV